MTKKLTPWFPGHIKPARPGVYQRQFNATPDLPLYSRWDGNAWRVSMSRPDVAAVVCSVSKAQVLPWRGLAQDPAKELNA